jgi:hypothetical protein
VAAMRSSPRRCVSTRAVRPTMEDVGVGAGPVIGDAFRSLRRATAL